MKRPIALVVEDDASVRIDAATLLEATGFEVVEAETAAKGLCVLQDRGEDVAVLFTDVRTPGSLSGAVLAREAARAWPHVRLIVTSGHPKGDNLPRTAAFLPKPWRPVEVLAHAGRACIGRVADVARPPAPRGGSIADQPRVG
jgi:DNA-binding NtrC family response regulator